MARPESDYIEVEAICIDKLFKEHNINHKCSCPRCSGKPKVGRPRAVEFPELLKGATKNEGVTR